MSVPYLSRRTLLGGAAVVGGAAALSACGASGSSTPSAGGPSAGEALVATADVPVGGGVVLESPAVVVTQPADGEFHAFSSICTHAGCPVSEVVDNEIVCTCHGSHYSATDGSVVSGPAPAPLPSVAVEVSGGEVVTA
jgi:Rieske Fe-S protein